MLLSLLFPVLTSLLREIRTINIAFLLASVAVVLGVIVATCGALFGSSLLLAPQPFDPHDAAQQISHRCQQVPYPVSCDQRSRA
jgi:hypothetical protein